MSTEVEAISAPAPRPGAAELDQDPGSWSLRTRLLLTAFFATHVPLIAVVAFVLASPQRVEPAMVVAVVLGATVLGTAVILAVLNRLLRPIALASEALRGFIVLGTRPTIPDARRDEIGVMLARLAQALTVMDQRTQLLESQAHRDHLTGLLNRRAAESQLHYSFALLERTRMPLCLALLDVDEFKRVNDRLGHAQGDRVLITVAEVLQRHARRKVDWVARWGGDELLVALYTELDSAEVILERLRSDLEQGRFEGSAPPVTVSIGLTACWPGEEVDACLARADAALYRAKQGGRNRVEVSG